MVNKLNGLKVLIKILLLFLFIIVSGCNASIENSEEAPQKKGIPVILNEVSIPMLNYKTLNPVVSKDESIYYLNKLIYESLVDLDKSLKAVPLLAEKWEYLQDGHELILYLQKNVIWHNGSEFSSDDVVFTINTYLNNKQHEPSPYKIFLANINKVEKVDEHTVRIIFKNNYDNSIEHFVFPILPEDASSGNIYINTTGFIPVGTGPYIVEEIEKLKYIKLKGNKQYWGDQKPLNNLTFKIVPSPEESIGLLEINDIHIAYSHTTDWGKYKEDKSLSIHEFISNEVEFIGFNFKNEALSDRRVRQAICHAIDTEEIIKHIYLGAAAESDSIFYPDYLKESDSNSKNFYNFNQDKSKELLKEAGYEDRNNNSVLEDINGKELSINLLVNSENKNRMDCAKIIKKSLDKIGIFTNIIYVGFDTYTQQINRGDFDLYLGGWHVSHLMDFRFALHSEYGNSIHYHNDYLNYLLVELQRNHTDEKKEELLDEIETIIGEDLPYYCLLYKKYGAVSTNELVGEIDPVFFDFYSGAKTWQIIREP